MLELSLHILDLVENAIRADASIVSIIIEEDAPKDVLRVCIEDNGRGMDVPLERALDPFFTTKADKKTGLGLSLFRAAAEQAAGRLTVQRSKLGGIGVEVIMQLTHIDRQPLGNLASTLSAVLATNPGLDLRCRMCSGDRSREVSAAAIAKDLGLDSACVMALAREFRGQIIEAQTAIKSLL